jgi:23S rRNA (cytidine2498-2'-O)-methyltransferase
MSCVVIYCRSGFESDAAAEITFHAAEQGFAGYVKAKPNTGYVVYECFEAHHSDEIIKKVDFKNMVFARQWFAGKLVENMPVEDRVSAVVEAAKDFALCSELRVETPDTNEGKELLTFCKKISTPLKKALEKKNIVLREPKANRPVMHALFLTNNTAYVGYSYSFNNSAYFMGILRLRMPSDGPSRSTLKLDEAFNVFIPEQQRETRVAAGMRGVDLGACPGG